MCHRTQDQRLLQTSPWDRDEAMEDGCNTSLDVGTNSLTMGISACLWLRMQFAPDSPGDRGPASLRGKNGAAQCACTALSQRKEGSGERENKDKRKETEEAERIRSKFAGEESKSQGRNALRQLRRELFRNGGWGVS